MSLERNIMSSPIRPEGESVAIGTFIKTASAQLVEVLGLSGLHFGVLDAEHAALDRSAIDLMLLAGRAAGLPLLLRPDSRESSLIQCALDCGAAGVVLPHVDSEEDARQAVARARYRHGTRGFSGSTRAAGYGAMPMADALAAGDATLVICQIESPEAVANAGAIARVEGVGGLLVGRADLAVAMGEGSASSAAVIEAAMTVARAARAAGKIAGMATGSAAECARFRAAGANWFIVSSDQGLLRQAAGDMTKAASGAT
jgi:2-keto-3-deoxy-L-rhamnonate aldolase RhmA